MTDLFAAPIAPPPGTDPAGFTDPAQIIAAMTAQTQGLAPVDTTAPYSPPAPAPPISSYQLPTEAPPAGVGEPMPPQTAVPSALQYAPTPPPADPFAAGATPPAPGQGAPVAPYPGAVGAPTPAPAQPTMVQLPDGTIIGLDRLSELAELDRSFNARPDIQQAVRETLSRSGLTAPILPPPSTTPQILPQQWPPQPVPPFTTQPVAPQPTILPPPSQYPQTAQLPPDVDPTDPTVQWVARQAAEMQSGYQAIQQSIAQQQASAAEANARASRTATVAAKEDIARKYPHLTFDDIARIEAQAGALQLGTAYMAMYGDHRRAAYEAMDSAALTLHDLRSKLQAVPASTQAAMTAQRQAQLNALAGTGGAAPRAADAQPRKMSAPEKQSAMAQELHAYLTAGGPG